MQKFKVTASIVITVMVVVGLWFEWLYYSETGNPASRRITFKEFYRLNHENQTYDFVMQKHAEYLRKADVSELSAAK